MTICPACSTENDDERLRCISCGNMIRTIDRSTRKIRRDEVMRHAAKLEVERTANLEVDLTPKPAPPTEKSQVARPAGPPPPPPPPTTVLLDWKNEASLTSGVLDAPYPLSRNSTVTIGRTEENNIVMPVHQVSRQHALVKWDGEGFAVVDRKSTNGTFVNGEPVQRRRLRAGDKIGIGPFELTFVQGLANHESDGNTSTVVVAIPGAFSGELVEVSVPEICQLIDLNQKTGILVFHEGDTRGKLVFQSGRATHAEFKDKLGDEAALELLALTKGSFRFFARDTADIKATIKRTTGSLLLEAARRIDESGEETVKVRDTDD